MGKNSRVNGINDLPVFMHQGSVPPEPASRDWPLPELLPARLTGAEPVIDDGRPVPRLTVLDFWRWAASDLADNVVRGWFAEFIVAAALGTHDGVRQSWDTVDVKTKAGKTIQVKCSAYLQSWAQKELSQVNFSVKPTRAWDAAVNGIESNRKDNSGAYPKQEEKTDEVHTSNTRVPCTESIQL